MHIFDYSDQGRRPSAAQVVKSWKDAGQPDIFQAEYGETYAEFSRCRGAWFAQGNGQRGVDRDAVVEALTRASRP
jgi:hypothetical protein